MNAIILPYVSQCLSKRKYPTYEKALDGAHATVKHDNSAILTVYRCPHCRNFHVGGVI